MDQEEAILQARRERLCCKHVENVSLLNYFFKLCDVFLDASWIFLQHVQKMVDVPPDCKVGPFPYGSKGPNNVVLGPKYYNMHDIWALKPYDLGSWNLRVPHLEGQKESVTVDKPGLSTGFRVYISILTKSA